mmetsp:Transcript_33792/g.38470  ORF Transcript_33792/g.38470 Transcript_33792/m.38470 type:complete len:177 (+) Transcript_33792:34-564(+)
MKYLGQFATMIITLASTNMTNSLSLYPLENRRLILLRIGGSAPAMLCLSDRQRQAFAEEVKVDPFNGLMFNYKNNKFNGLDASDLKEPSVPFLEFGERLKKGEVALVKFYAPDGDRAYVTFKSSEGGEEKPIRIGEGFPIEQHDGYSSPSFVVRALQNYNVPYKFVVPGLEKYKNM